MVMDRAAEVADALQRILHVTAGITQPGLGDGLGEGLD